MVNTDPHTPRVSVRRMGLKPVHLGDFHPPESDPMSRTRPPPIREPTPRGGPPHSRTRVLEPPCRCTPTYRAQVWIADPSVPGRVATCSGVFQTLRPRSRGESNVAPTPARRIARSASGGHHDRRGGRADARRDALGKVGTPRRPRYRPGVIREYHASAVRYLLPTLGRRRLDVVAMPDLLHLAGLLELQGCSPSTIRNAFDPLRVIYRRATMLGLVAYNPTRGLELPTGATPRDRVADPIEAAKLITSLPSAYLRALWSVALYGGLRGGELRALRWGDVTLHGLDRRVAIAGTRRTES